MVSNSRQWGHFSNYIDALIEQQQRTLEQSDNMVTIHRAQGAIATLHSLQKLRDAVDG
jgi:hypothetical protein